MNSRFRNRSRDQECGATGGITLRHEVVSSPAVANRRDRDFNVGLEYKGSDRTLAETSIMPKLFSACGGPGGSPFAACSS
jgi:hypothetical protein